MLAAFVAVPGGAATQSSVAPPPPPFAGAYQPRGVDEIGLWREMDEDERALANSPIVIRDEALNRYVRGVLCAAVGADRCGATRIYIVRIPEFNAAMGPNGTMLVNSGLLLRVRSEAELASVLGHEFGHFEHRHTLADFKARRRTGDFLSWAGVAAAMVNTGQAWSDYRRMQVSSLGGISRFNRDQEREADLRAVSYLNVSTLRPQAAATVWQNQIAEAQASASARGLRKPNFDRIAFLASHPPSAERAATMAALASPAGAERDDGAGRYAAAMADWLPLFLDDQIKLNDFGGSEYILNSLAHAGWTAPLLLARGDLYRARGNPRDLVNAADFYQQAELRDAALAEASRGLGLALIKTGRPSEGREALRRYLALRPEAKDAGMIAMLVAAQGETR